jgi:hypothetical protein
VNCSVEDEDAVSVNGFLEQSGCSFEGFSDTTIGLAFID